MTRILTRACRAAALALLATAGPARAADLLAEEGAAVVRRADLARGGCRLPPGYITRGPDSPGYVGSPYGLGKPNYYGFGPPHGRDPAAPDVPCR